MIYLASPITGEALIARSQAVSVNAMPEVFLLWPVFSVFH